VSRGISSAALSISYAFIQRDPPHVVISLLIIAKGNSRHYVHSSESEQRSYSSVKLVTPLSVQRCEASSLRTDTQDATESESAPSML
jgi:hypothetical protein